VRRPVLLAVALVAAGAVAVPAQAAPKPKPFKGSKSYTDQTPDPTASDPSSNFAGCDTLLPATYPHEAGITVTIPAPGKLKASLNNQLDWAIEVRDAKGTTLAGADGGMPNDPESVTAKIKKAGKYVIYPCNLTGEPTVTVTWSYTPS
jgi:hypothetical protein